MNQNANTLGIFTEHVPRMSCPHCGAELDVSEFGVFEEITCPACQQAIKVPGRLGNFVLLEELGRGAMGCVYLAHDESLGRRVALKVMRREYGDDPKMLETLQREAQAMAALNHPNVVQVYSFGRESGQPYFVMELLQGERLDEMMADGGIVDEVRLLEIAVDVAKGLEAAANAGMTHGDIKPANILMNDAGVAKVVDFGLARFTESGGEIEVWGTPYYIAPEKARKKGEDARSDQYSLGATLFHALAGHPPFDGENPTKVVLAALKEETPDLLAHNPNVCVETAAVIRRMMDKTPARRYPTYASLIADLELALAAARRKAEERRLAEELAEQQRRAPKNYLPMIMTVVVIGILAVGGIIWFVSQKRKAEIAKLDKWPDRKLEAPFLRAEERNLLEAVQALAKNNFRTAEEKLSNAERLIPAEHAALAWQRFFAAGMMIYAQYPDRARSLLEQAVNQDPIVFSGGRVPPEDPRLLARHALDQLSERDLDRAVQKSTQPYFAHLAELAKGYRHMLGGRPNDAARHFRFYGDTRGQGWPYVLQPLAATLHATRPQMTGDQATPTPTPFLAPTPTPTPRPVAPVATPTSRPANLPVVSGPHRDAEGRPVFRVGALDREQKVVASTIAPPWSKAGEVGYQAWINANQVLVNATGVQILPERRFTLGGILRTPAQPSDPTKLPVLFHVGGPGVGDGADQKIRGLVVEVAEQAGRVGLRVRIGNGETDLFSSFITPPEFKPGTVQLFLLVWDGSTLTLNIDGKSVGSWTPRPDQMPELSTTPIVAWGRGMAANNVFSLGNPGEIEVLRAMVFDHVPDLEAFFTTYAERIRNWNK